MPDNRTLKIYFLGDVSHPNAINWIHGLEKYGNCTIKGWSLPSSKGARGRVERIASWLQALTSIKSDIQQYKPDVLIGYRITSYGFLAAWTGFRPLVIASQGITDVWPENHYTTPLKAFLARYAIKHADLIQAWGPHMAQTMFDLGADPSKTLILPRGIDLEIFRFNEAKDNTRLNIVVTRALHSDYRHLTILKAVKALVERSVPFHLTIIGEGVERANIESFIVENNLSEKVTLTGRVDNHKILPILQESNVYLAMPISEGVSASLIEAMACGCYPIVSDLIANHFWIADNVNGKLVEVDNVESLAEALQNTWESIENIGPVLLDNRKLIEEKGDMRKNMSIFAENYRRLTS